MGKYSVERDRILSLYWMYGIKYSDEKPRIFQKFLKVYSSLAKELPFMSGQLNKQVSRDELKKIFNAMIIKPSISEEEITEVIFSIARSGIMDEITDGALKKLKGLNETYHTIIYMTYFDEVKHSTEEIIKATRYKKTRFYEKREYAIMYMGLMIWLQISGYWEESDEDKR